MKGYSAVTGLSLILLTSLCAAAEVSAKTVAPRPPERLQQLTEKAPADELRFLLLGERQRVRQLSQEGLRDTGAASLVNRAVEQIGLRLQYWTESRVGRAISSPSSVETEAALMVMALRQISENEDAAVLSLVAYAAALRRAMAFPVSLFFIDESPILFKFPSVVSLVASIISNGAKSGVRVILSAQDPNTIFNSKHGQQIFQNINTKLIGRIQPTAISSFVQILGYDEDLVGRCANFFPKRLGLFYTNWLLDDNGTLTFCRFYVAPVLLALVANNTDEQSWRQRFLESYPDKYQAISQFSLALSEAIQSAVSLEAITPKYLPAGRGRGGEGERGSRGGRGRRN